MRNAPLSLLLTVLNLASAHAQDFTWATNGDSITVTGYAGPGGEVEVPALISGLPVVNIGANAFYDQETVTNCSLPDTLTNISDAAFSLCVNLRQVAIPDGVVHVGNQAFAQCTSLAWISLPSSLTNVGHGAFAECTGLTNITIPNSVHAIHSATFFECSSLTAVVIGESVTNIESTVFWGCSSLGSVRIPDAVIGIGGGAFRDCESLTNVTIGSAITTIGGNAFQPCANLRSVFFRGNAPSLGIGTFGGAPGEITMYYLPGTSGWGATFGDRPTALWNPVVEIGDGSFGVGTNGFGFTITGTADIPIVVEADVQLNSSSGMALHFCSLTNGSVYFSDPDWDSYPGRFYTIRSP